MTTIKLRRGDAASWTSANPLLAEGEMGVELDTARLKFGDGVNSWNLLEYHFPTSDVQDLIDAAILSLPAGPAGPPGSAYLSAQWNFNQNLVVSPASGTMRMNATTYAAVTTLWIHEIDRDGLDRSAGLNTLLTGDQVIMQSAQGRAVWNVTGHSDSGTYRTLTVTLAESSGSRPSASSVTTIYIVNNQTGHPIQDEGTPVPYRTAINFIGPGITVSDDAPNDRVNITMPSAPVLVLGPATPVPGGTAAGTVIVRTVT